LENSTDNVAALIAAGKLYKCEPCECYFSEYAMYRIHSKIHPGGRMQPFCCPICSEDCHDKVYFSLQLASLGLRTAINGNISLPILQQLFTCTPTSDESIFKFESMTSFFILSEPLNDLDLDRLIEVGEGLPQWQCLMLYLWITTTKQWQGLRCRHYFLFSLPQKFRHLQRGSTRLVSRNRRNVVVELIPS
jgi:hypothetical protein